MVVFSKYTKQRIFLKFRSIINLPGPSQLESAIIFTLQCFIYSTSLFYVCKASAIVVPHTVCACVYEDIVHVCAHAYMHRPYNMQDKAGH